MLLLRLITFCFQWCAILDEHLLFLMNFNPLRDTAEEIKTCWSELEKFNAVAKVCIPILSY